MVEALRIGFIIYSAVVLSETRWYSPVLFALFSSLYFCCRVSQTMREGNIVAGRRGRGNNWALGK